MKKPGQRRAEGAGADPGERELQNNGNNGYGTRTGGYKPGRYYYNNNYGGGAYNSYGGQGATYASGYAQGQAGYGYNNGNDGLPLLPREGLHGLEGGGQGRVFSATRSTTEGSTASTWRSTPSI